MHQPIARKTVRAVAVAAAFVAGLMSFASITHAQTNDRINLSALQTGEQYSGFIVHFHPWSRAAGDPTAVQAAADAVAKTIGAKATHVRQLAAGGELIDFGLDYARLDATSIMELFAADPDVAYVEPNAIMRISLSPNDTRYGEQWHYFEAAGGLNLPLAWDIANGTGVTVAVLDTGSTNHNDLNGNTIAGYDFISSATTARDGNGRDSNPNDEGDWWTNSECGAGAPPSQNSSWHGTHVAGTVAAVTNNSNGVAGVAFGAKVQHARVLGKCGGTLADIADAIVWASGGTVSGVPANATPAKVVNMSLGGSGTCGTTYQNAITSAVGRGTVVIVAAGNSNTNASNARPANCNNVVAVAAVGRNGGKASYSNFGAVVDVAAPGGGGTGVLSTLNTGTTTPGSQSYAFYQGTSMATPHVAGAAALILDVASKTPAEIETILRNTARAFPATCSQCGTGIVNALAAVQAAGGGGGGGTTFFENTADYAINDLQTTESPIAVNRTGNAPSNLQVAVRIIHTYRGDLIVNLVAPDGSTYLLHNGSGGSADNLIGTYTVNASSEVANGTWRLRVYDRANVDTGYIDSWSLQF